uniref:Zinc finger protein 638 n=1 Tax=Catharus ustulatus TaxID=91951 RepID=A0A8C3V0H1_CATUS
MFSPRGTLPPRPRGPNPSGTKAPGAFGAGGAAGPPRKAAPATPQGAPQRFSGQDAPQWAGSQRINVRVTLHRADPRKVKEKSNLHQEQKGDPRANRWDGGPCPAGAAGPKPPGPAPVLEQNSNPQNRYTPESASSILASFGLSNEDLEELSRYPDDQLTPENMPRILREIRIRKLGHAVPGLHAASRGEEPAGDGGGVAVKGKVIDYGHASKYGYTEDPLEIRTYTPEALPEDSAAENREEFQREQSVPVAVPPPPNVPCNPVFPAEELIKLPAFPGDSSPAPPFFPAEPPAKAPGLCGAAPAALPAVKPVSQPPMPPVMPPMLPALLPSPMPQPMLPPKQRDTGGAHAGPGPAGGTSAGHKPFHKPFQSTMDEPIKSPFGVVKASWLPVFPDSQKSKRLPTPSMMNDYYATSPRIFPHLCSLCNLECTHMKVSGFPRLFPKRVYSAPFPAAACLPWEFRLLREELLSCGTVLQISELPEQGFTDQDIKRLVQPFGKVSDLIVLRSRNEAYLEMNFKEAVLAAVKFAETTPLLLNGKRVRVKKWEKMGKIGKKLWKVGKMEKKLEKMGKNLGKNGKMGKKWRKIWKMGKKIGKKLGKSWEKMGKNLRKIGGKWMKFYKKLGKIGGKNRKNWGKMGKNWEKESCVLLISNLPDKGSSPQEISNLAKPFGALRDLLVLSSHKKAYVELPRRAAEAMVRFYSCFPMAMEGNQISVSLEPRHRNLGDEEAIFIALIKESDPKLDSSCLRSQLVHLGNLPAEGFRELEVVCAGLRFGKVEHYAVLSNRHRAILQLDSPKSARYMHSFLQQYPYSMGEHTLTCSLSCHADTPEVTIPIFPPFFGVFWGFFGGGRTFLSGLKKNPEGLGTVQKTAGNPSGEPRKGQTPSPNVQEEIPGGQLETPESQQGAAGMDVEGLDPEIGIPVDPVDSKSPGARAEEKPGAGKDEAGDEPELEIQKEDEEPSAPAVDLQESSNKGIPAGGTPGANPGMSPSSEEAPAVSPGVTQPSTELAAPEKAPIPEAGKNSWETSTERKAVPKSGDAPGKKWDAAGAEREGTAEESIKMGENPGKIWGKAGTELEKTPGKTSCKGGENSGSAAGETHVGSSVKISPNKGMGAAKSDENRAAAPVNPAGALKESCVGKTLLKAVVSVPDILKQRIPVRITEPSLGKAGEQKIPPKAGLEKKIPGKAAAQTGAGNQWRGNGNSGMDAQGDGGKSSSQQEKDSQLESRGSSKQQGESGTSGTRENPGGNQVRNSDTISISPQEEELFPFNLDEFVTVDEVLEDAESPVTPRRNPPRGKRKETPKANPSEPASKKRRGKSGGAEGELSFVTLDEIGEEEEAPVPLPGVDPQGLVVVDEVVEEEELSEAVKDPQALLTLDEISEQEEPGSHGSGTRGEFEERDLKAEEPLVTVDEIGEVEELPLNEPAELSAAEEGKANPGDCAASQVPDDPNALVTVDEIQEDNEDNPLVTLDEVNEDEDDFLADFNHLKEELNFVTVDEVGDEEEESTFPGKNLPEDEDDEDIVAVAGPEEMGILGDTNPEEELAEISKPKGRNIKAIPSQRAFLSPAAQLGSEDVEPKSQQKKTTFPGVPKTQSTPKALDILVPKAGFFCQICSLFYADEPSMINHCRTALHRQNMEKFMAKQQDNGGEEPSSR